MIEDRPRSLGPRGVAIEVEKNIERFTGKLAAAPTMKERMRRRKLISLNRNLLRFCKTRAG